MTAERPGQSARRVRERGGECSEIDRNVPTASEESKASDILLAGKDDGFLISAAGAANGN